MGGDHKCPVCQATFTRPQHVARHMRSHTGDRPYKCQYCGDQFARSDLLSRHVNKCHANEKPLPTTGGTRRKGSASASRATTSKQACDQCVQSSLPCDGCNPCSKCVQRKCRCTFVKFHRQTAPAGPGHNIRPPAGSVIPNSLLPMQSTSSSRLPMFSQHPDDDFILGPPPTNSGSGSGGVQTMAETLYNSNSFAFPALYPTNTNTADSLGADAVPDYASKYRAQAQAELFGPGRSGLGTGLTPLYDPRGGSSANSGAGWLGWDNQPPPSAQSDTGDAYHHHQQQQQQQHQQDHGRLIPASSSAGSAMHDKQTQHLLQHHQSQGQPHYMAISMPYPVSGSGAYGVGGSHSTNNVNNNNTGGSTTTSGGGSDRGANDRRGSIDLVNDYDQYSAGGGSDGSHSVPSSAASSSVHLPLTMMAAHQHQLHQHQQQNHHQQQQAMYNAGYNMGMMPDRSATASTSSSSSSQQHRGNYGADATAAGYAPHDERQEFSSAFGLMSLDDPNVIAGLAVDGQPFFSDPDHAHNQHESSGSLMGQDMDTPMPMKQEAAMLQLPLLEAKGTPSRESDTRELREFWKQYMRTPLSGPGPANGMGDLMTSSKGSTPYRRPRVASLPSAKTPVMERDALYGDVIHGPNADDDERKRKLGPMSSLRTTLHGNHEDLRSYEAAVMARKAPTNLNLQIKKPMKPRGGVPPANFGSRPRSAVDNASSSSLANAFGGSSNPNPTGQQPPPPSAPAGRVTFAMKKEDSSSPSIGGHSRASSSAVEDSDNSSNPDQDSLRPSFKRLPSQTLGPASSKRAFLGSSSEREDSQDRQLVGWGTAPADPAAAGTLKNNSTRLQVLPGISHPDRVVASLSERRRRRMSAPSSSSMLQPPPTKATTSQGGREHEQNDEKPSGKTSYTPGGVAGVAYAPAAQAGAGN